jgi:hypothetical protein
MKRTFGESVRLFLAMSLLTVISCGPIYAVCGIIISSADAKAMALLLAAFKLV